MGSINLPEQLIEYTKPVYSLDYHFFFLENMTKNMNPSLHEEIHVGLQYRGKVPNKDTSGPVESGTNYDSRWMNSGPLA